MRKADISPRLSTGNWGNKSLVKWNDKYHKTKNQINEHSEWFAFSPTESECPEWALEISFTIEILLTGTLHNRYSQLLPCHNSYLGMKNEMFSFW
jgi:hypothetical protein